MLLTELRWKLKFKCKQATSRNANQNPKRSLLFFSRMKLKIKTLFSLLNWWNFNTINISLIPSSKIVIYKVQLIHSKVYFSSFRNEWIVLLCNTKYFQFDFHFNSDWNLIDFFFFFFFLARQIKIVDEHKLLSRIHCIFCSQPCIIDLICTKNAKKYSSFSLAILYQYF